MVHSLIDRLLSSLCRLVLLELYEAQPFMPAIRRPRDVDGLHRAVRAEQLVYLIMIYSEF